MIVLELSVNISSTYLANFSSFLASDYHVTLSVSGFCFKGKVHITGNVVDGKYKSEQITILIFRIYS